MSFWKNEISLRLPLLCICMRTPIMVLVPHICPLTLSSSSRAEADTLQKIICLDTYLHINTPYTLFLDALTNYICFGLLLIFLLCTFLDYRVCVNCARHTDTFILQKFRLGYKWFLKTCATEWFTIVKVMNYKTCLRTSETKNFSCPFKTSNRRIFIEMGLRVLS